MKWNYLCTCGTDTILVCQRYSDGSILPAVQSFRVHVCCFFGWRRSHHSAVDGLCRCVQRGLALVNGRAIALERPGWRAGRHGTVAHCCQRRFDDFIEYWVGLPMPHSSIIDFANSLPCDWLHGIERTWCTNILLWVMAFRSRIDAHANGARWCIVVVHYAVKNAKYSVYVYFMDGLYGNVNSKYNLDNRSPLLLIVI